MEKNYTFPRQERLRNIKLIEKLFEQGRTLMAFPLKMVFLKNEESLNFPIQATFSVSRKKFRLAIHRNKLKRLMREAYRLNKYILFQNKEHTTLAIMFIYMSDELLPYKNIESAMNKLLRKLL